MALGYITLDALLSDACSEHNLNENTLLASLQSPLTIVHSFSCSSQFSN